MDRNIPRDVQAVSVHADSAFRRNGQSPYRYRVFFNPNDSRTAERIKDVVSVGVERASLPTMHDNILPGINIVNLHVGVRTATGAATTISDMASLIAYFAARNVELTLGASGTFLRSLHEQNVLLISDQETPGSTRAGDDWCLLATTQSTEWVTPTFPLDLALTACENHRVLLKPGFYPTHDQMIRELFDSFESMIPPATALDDNLFITNASGAAATTGWSAVREANGSWMLQYCSPTSAVVAGGHAMFLTREPTKYGFDALSQLGLRGAAQIFPMTRYSSSVDPTSNTIIPQGDVAAGTSDLHVFFLQFAPINLNPRRYVDIVVENIPHTSITNNQNHVRGTVARVHLSSARHVYESTSASQTLQQDSYVFYENKGGFTPALFDPVSLHFLQVRLVDNLGVAYESDLDHHIEFKILRLGDAKVPFQFPTHSTGSVMAHTRRALYEEPEKEPKKEPRAHKRKPKRTEHDTPGAPLSGWLAENRVAVGATTITFFGVLYLSSRLGLLAPPNPTPLAAPAHHDHVRER